ncbi:MAG: hypothetical protein ACYCX9_05390 [Candidatus Dormibacteria bacterium]
MKLRRKVPRGGESQYRITQHLPGSRSPEHAAVVDTIPTGQHRIDWIRCLAADIEPTRRFTQLNALLEHLPRHQVLGQSGRSEESGIGHQTGILEGCAQTIHSVG